MTLSLLHPITRTWLPAPALLALATLAPLPMVRLLRALSASWRIERDGQRWHLQAAGHDTIRNATLIRGGFCSGSHLVLRFRDEHGRTLSLTVWRDAIEPVAFSHLRLAVLGARGR